MKFAKFGTFVILLMFATTSFGASAGGPTTITPRIRVTAGPITMKGIAAPGVSAAGEGAFYFDSGTNTFKSSLNGAAYGSFGTGTVTSVSVVTANGVSGSVATATTTPAITITLGAITPTTVNGLTITASTGTLTVTNGKTLTVSDSTTLATNSVTFAGGEVVTFTATNALTLTTTGGTNVTLPTSGTLLSTAAAVTVPQGGTGVATLAANGVLYGAGSSAVSVTAQGGTNTILVASAGAPSFSATPIIQTSLQLGVVSSATGSLKLANSASANLTTITAGNAAAARTYVWPTNFGAAGTVLTDAAGNGTLSWAAAGGVSYPLLATDGSAAAPSYSFAASTGTGMYSPATNQLALAANGSLLLHHTGTNNFFAGVLAGNASVSGQASVGVGKGALNGLTGSNGQTAVGWEALFTKTDSGDNNVAIGYYAMRSLTTGTQNTAVGTLAMNASTTVSNNIAIGNSANVNCSNDYTITIGNSSYTGGNTSIAIGYAAYTTAANQLVIGSDDANGSITQAFLGQGETKASPAGITINATGGSGADNAGATLTIAGGKATGNAAGGSIDFQTSVVAGSSSTLQSLLSRFTITNTGSFVVPTTITTVGTTGNQTIDKPTGRVNIATGGTTVTVTNSLCTVNSTVLVVAATADATARVTSVVPAAGSFVINTVATTAETAFSFFVLN